MGWKDLLQTDNERLVAPWVGGRSLRTYERTWRITGRLPAEYGWHEFKMQARKANWSTTAEAPQGILREKQRGYLVGDRFVPEGTTRVDSDVASLVQRFERAHLIEPGLDRFVRVTAGRFHEDGPLIYEGQEFPLGPEMDVLQAFLNQAPNLNDVGDVVPALDAAFRVESWRRAEAEKRRREEEERRKKEERRLKLQQAYGDGALRREVAKEDFGEAAKAALGVGGAVYLDHRQAYRRDEMVVRFRVNRGQYECTCHPETLRIIDSGICLTDHDTGEKGDTYFTLESLPGVIRQAYGGDRLVAFRHMD
jgi:hypothetical protein